MRVIVCGSRTWGDYALIERVLARLPQEAVIVHGGQATWDYERKEWIGADCLAWHAAQNLGFDVDPHPADWDQHGRAAGPIRNEEMLRAGADMVLAFRMPGVSRGTDHMIKIAAEAGVPTYVFSPDGTWREA